MVWPAMSSNRNESRAAMLRLVHPFVAEVAQAGGLRRRDSLENGLELYRSAPPDRRPSFLYSVVRHSSLHKQTSTKVSTRKATGLRHKCVTELLKSSP